MTCCIIALQSPEECILGVLPHSEASCGDAVGDLPELHRALERYEDIDYTFSGSREGKLLRVCFLALRQSLCKFMH